MGLVEGGTWDIRGGRVLACAAVLRGALRYYWGKGVEIWGSDVILGWGRRWDIMFKALSIDRPRASHLGFLKGFRRQLAYLYNCACWKKRRRTRLHSQPCRDRDEIE